MSLLIAETRMPTAGLSWLYIGYRIQDTGYRIQDVSYHHPTGNHPHGEVVACDD